jgi:nitroreductase
MSQDSLPIAGAVESAIETRASVRAFNPDPVSRATVERLLDLAARAPSSTNCQPWHVYAVAGAVRDKISKLGYEAMMSGDMGQPEFSYYPKEWYEPYKSRRRDLGVAMYRLLGIEKGDTARMTAQQAHNTKFFDAPVGLFFTVDRAMLPQGYVDTGLFMATFMIAARGMGLATCPQLSWTHYHHLIRPVLNIPDDQQFISGMALGYADDETAVNRLRSTRVPAAEFCQFSGF